MNGTTPLSDDEPLHFVDDDFWEYMERLRDAEPDMNAERVPFPPKVYSELSDDELAYYLKWRRELIDGVDVERHPGCEWLRICEIIDDDKLPYEDGQRQFRRMISHYRGGSSLFEHVLYRTFADYRLTRKDGMDAKDIESWDELWLSLVFQHPVMPLEWKGLMYACDYYPDNIILDDFNEVISHAAVAVDRMLMEKTGKGLGDTCMKRTVMRYKVFQHVPYRHERTYACNAYRFPEGKGKTILAGLMKYCIRLEYGDKVRISREFDDDMRKAVDDSYKHPESYRTESVDRRIVIVPLSEFVPDETVNEQEGGVELPALHLMTDFRSNTHADFHARIKENWGKDHPEPMGYVASGNRYQEYHYMKREQVDYYTHWRGRVYEGRYLETDDGYIWLLLSEIINMEQDKGRCMEIMEGLKHHYPLKSRGFLTNMNIIEITYLDYSIYHGLYLDKPSVTFCYHSAYSSVLNLLNKGEPLCMEAVLLITNITHQGMRSEIDDDCAGILSLVLRELDSRERGGLLNYYMIPHKKGRVRVFDQAKFKFPSRSRTAQFDYVDFHTNECFIQDMNNIVKDIIRALRMRRGEKKQKMSGEKCFGFECGALILKKTEEWFKSKRTAVAVDLTLDDAALKTAEKDLEKVAELMHVDEPESEKPAGRGPKKVAGKLTPLQVEYIRIILDGRDPTEYLGSKRKSRQTVESGINQVAMDDIGDTVIEDGEPVEEYLDWLRGMCGRS